MIVPLWAIVGTFYLIILTVQDYRKNNFVDDRYNFFMYGATIMLLSHVQHTILYMLMIIALGIGLRYYINKFKLTGEADANTFAWIFTGYGFMNFQFLITGLIMFIAVLILTGIFKFAIFRNKEAQAFYGIILIFFVITNILLGVYGF